MDKLEIDDDGSGVTGVICEIHVRCPSRALGHEIGDDKRGHNL